MTLTKRFLVRRVFALFALLAVTAAGHTIYSKYLMAGQELTELEANLRNQYPGVKNADPGELSKVIVSQSEQINASEKPIILDVREQKEFNVSHLPGAQRVSPDISAEELMSQLKDVKDRTVIVYCSVGMRSSRLASRVQSKLQKNGAKTVINLSGGIFRWHNEKRPLSRKGKATDVVHPYDSWWGRYVDRQKLTRYEPS